jgi:nanoRNase/pAp phosphatase (c-di-AMP/oligoRNAs hydrolase)
MAVDLDALRKVLPAGKRMLIVTHDHPDPDALASAFAMAKLCEALCEVKSRIVCDGIVGRAENRALKREMHLKLFSAARINWRKWPLITLVDSQPHTGNNCLPRRRSADIVIDHHALRRHTHAKYLDVRPNIGACATIMAEYLWADDAPVGAELAAGLCYAIASETQDLAREASAQDTNAYARLYIGANKKMLGRVQHPALKHSYYSTLSHALLAAFTYGNIIGSHLGVIDHPDSVSLAADLLLRHERNTWSIVTGVWNNDLHVSLRTLNRSAHAGRVLRRVLSGRGVGGGHERLAGGKISLKGLDLAQQREMQDMVVQRLIKIVRRRTDVLLKPLITPAELERAGKFAGRTQIPLNGAAKEQERE